MQDLQYTKTFLKNELTYPRVLGLWLFLIPSKLKPINEKEKELVQNLPSKKRWLYHFSRGYARHAISLVTHMDPLCIPLDAKPGKPPLLKKGWGHISFSHCNDALLIGWSTKKIGVDIERSDRQFKSDQLSRRYFSKEENAELQNLRKDERHSAILERWVIKEAAIKWNRDTISSNLNQWEWQKNTSIAIHKSKKNKVHIQTANLEQWTFAIACNDPLNKKYPILCIN